MESRIPACIGSVMSRFLDIALRHAARGWHVFPCIPRGKRPVTKHGWHDATTDEAKIRAWWTKTPQANVGIACGPSNLAVFDVDHGMQSHEDFERLRAAMNLPETYAVRTGRRTDYGVQVYFAGGIEDVGDFRIAGCQGQIKSLGGYVMAAGCVHPDSGERYEVLQGDPDNLAPLPDNVRALKSEKPKTGKPGEPITENRNIRLYAELCALRARGHSEDGLVVTGLQFNADNVVPPLEDAEVKQIARNAAKHDVPAPDPIAVLTEAKPVTDWRERYLTFERVRDAKPVEFLIEGWLALDSITALAAPVGQRKSLIAMNVAHALCTGEPLFGYFKVAKQPSRVVYLCPEMGLSSFSKRLKGIGLDSYVGKTLFCQTMDEDAIKLKDLDGELPGAVVIIDTLTRFVEGNQNEAEDMSRFAKVIFTLKRRGATVLLLHHSNKGPANAPITLDSAMRGSTELAAFVTSCWATRLQNPDEPYKSPSLLVNVKQRDFESKPFVATCDENCRMRIAGEPGPIAELKSKADVEAEAALAAILKADPKMGINKLRAALKAAGKGRGQKWITRARAAILGTGVTLTSS
jgi:hypothetical protein